MFFVGPVLLSLLIGSVIRQRQRGQRLPLSINGLQSRLASDVVAACCADRMYPARATQVTDASSAPCLHLRIR